jgi:thiosulfate dehydrogenase (quinone) large subunit
VLGLWLRPALTSGSLLMILLLTGTCLLQDLSVAGLQLGYLAFYSALLATATCDRFSIDDVLQSRTPVTVELIEKEG